jgi:hypothetical protein
MQQGRTAGKGFAPKRFIDYLSSPHPIQAKIARVIARTEKGLTAYEIQDLAGCSVYSVRSVLKAMKALKGVYVCDWRRTSMTGLTGFAAVYKVGSLPDVERPKVVGDQVVAPKKAKAPVIKKDKEVKVIEAPPCPITQHLIALSKALVPKRNEQEQQEVNRLYLNWISEGTYG